MICLALLIFCLAERQVRQALAPHGGMMTGLPGYGPALARPTGRTIFRALADLRLIPAHDGNPATIPKPAGVQARLLDLLNIDISRPAGSARKTHVRRTGLARPSIERHDRVDDRQATVTAYRPGHKRTGRPRPLFGNVGRLRRSSGRRRRRLGHVPDAM